MVEDGDLRRHRAHYDVIVMMPIWSVHANSDTHADMVLLSIFTYCIFYHTALSMSPEHWTSTEIFGNIRDI